MENKIKFFKSIPFLEQLSRNNLEFIINACEIKNYFKDDIIFKQGNKGNGMYIIMFGKVEVQIDCITVSTLSNNQFFGELSLVTTEPRTATIKVASNHLAVLFLSRTAFRKIKDEIPEEAKKEMQRRIIENFNNKFEKYV